MANTTISGLSTAATIANDADLLELEQGGSSKKVSARNLIRGLLLGTVSQSGGTPTGAVIERGSNANGEYVKFADGTQICYINKYISIVPNLALGPLYLGKVNFDFPLSFVVPPVVSPGRYQYGDGANWVGIGSVGTTGGGARIFDIAMRSSLTELFQVQAIGRWY